MKNPHYTHIFICETCKKLTNKKNKDKLSPRYCSQKCSQIGRIGYKMCREIRIERAIKSFEKNVIKKDGCWGWKGRLIYGYGYISTKCFGSQRAHRVSYIIHKGEIPKDLCVLHSCHNRSCTNPEHLRLGTHQDNIEDKCKALRQNFNIEKNKIKAIKIILETKIFTDFEVCKIFKIRKSCLSAIMSGVLS